MRVLGLEITRAKAALPALGLSEWNGSPWSSLVREPFAGAWQRGISVDAQSVIRHSTVWACVSLISSDIAKIAVDVIRRGKDGIWEKDFSSAFSPILREPNHYQNRIEFFEYWILSKLNRGNTYALKRRDGRQVVDRLYILDPTRVKPLVADDGSVYYELGTDNLAGIEAAVRVPASEIIHDRYKAPFHPLCGVPPLFACALAALQGLKIQESSARFFQQNSKPGGVLTAPAQISNETAERIQKHWEANFAGEENAGKVAVLGDGLKYEAMAQTAVESQMIEQLNWGDARICGCYHVPPFLVGVEPYPGDTEAERLMGIYYSQCLQSLFEKIELCLDLGLSMPADLGIEFDTDALIRMNAERKMKIATDGVKGGVFAPNEARKRYFNLPAVTGGEAPMLQQQNWSLEDLAKRREMGVMPKPATTPTALDQPEPTDAPDDEETKALGRKAYRAALFMDEAA